MGTHDKVVIAIPVLLTGGTEVQTLNLVRVLNGAGNGVVVLCYYEYESEMVGYMDKAGAEVILLKLRREDGLSHLLKKLIVRFKELSPNIVHVQYVAPGLIPIIAARMAGIKTVFATVHQPGRPYGRKAKLLLRLGARLCTSFFCVSRAAEESWFGTSELFDLKLEGNQNRKHYTIYNAVDISTIAATSSRVDLGHLRRVLGLDEHPVVCIVGRLRGEKGHSVLLDAVAAIATKIPNVRLLVIGDGPDRESLKLKADVLGINSNIVWLGQKSQDEVFKLLAISDIAVVPSLFEGFGLTAAEAMAAGLLVVGSDVDGLREVIEHGETGILVPPGDSFALADALTEFLKHPDRAKEMGAKGRERVGRLFSVEKFYETMTAVYGLFAKG